MALVVAALAAGAFGRLAAGPVAPGEQLTVTADAAGVLPEAVPAATEGQEPSDGRSSAAGHVRAPPEAPPLGGWTPIAPAPVSPRTSFASAWTGSELVVWGGERVPTRGSAPWLDDGAAYDPQRDRWRRLAPSPLRGRSGAASAWTGSELVVWGGATGEQGGGVRVLADGAAYDPRADRWRRLPPAPLGGRLQATAATIAGQVVILGGFDEHFGQRRTDGAVYDPTTDRWRRLPPAPLPADAHFAPQLAALGSEAFVWIPTWGKGRQAAARYDLRTDRWRPAAAPILAGRPAPVLTSTGSGLLAAGRATGYQAAPLLLRYDAEPDRWLTLAPPPTSWQAATRVDWTGSRLLLSPAAGVEGAAAYDPATNAWRPLAPPPPTSRSAAHAWTGRQLLVWSGAAPAGGPPAAAGAPSSPWRAVADGPPLPTGGLGMTSTGPAGAQVLVWGGSSGPPDPPVGDGLAYRPGTGLWLSLAGAPIQGRRRAAVAWTGSEMVVLGGFNGRAGADRAEGSAAYELADGRWRPTAEPPLHAVEGGAVAVGGSVIAFGTSTDPPAARRAAGRRLSAPAAARWDPARDRWHRLPPPPLPAGSQVRAVATGADVVVWASVDGGGSRGARLDVGARRWRPLPVPGARPWTRSRSPRPPAWSWSRRTGRPRSCAPAPAAGAPSSGSRRRVPKPQRWCGRRPGCSPTARNRPRPRC